MEIPLLRAKSYSPYVSTAPADWYPDPTHRYERRYWNGAVWTEHVWAAGLQGIDSLSPAPMPSDSLQDDRAASNGTLTLSPATTNAARSVLTNASPSRQTKRQGRDEFESIALAAAHGDASALAALPAALDHAAQLYRGRALEDKKWQVLTLGIRDVLNDDRMSEDEQQHLARLSAALGLNVEDLAVRNLAVFEELVIAGLNDGRVPRAEVPILLKPGEFGRASFAAALMKEVAVREMRGGSSGLSIRVTKGVTYRTGQMRARSVVVGSQLQVQDVGVLSITNSRVVFVGRARTIEFRLEKLVSIEQFRDGLSLSVSNRQLASLFRITPPYSPLIAGAIITQSLAYPS
jgi:hypothetical protein